MKKLITLSCVALFAISVSAQELAYDKSYAKWSFGVKAGIDYYRVDPYATDGFKTPLFGAKYDAYALQASWAVPALFFEYTINPYFGIGFEAGWLHYNRGVKGRINPITGVQYADGRYLGSTIDGLVVGSINILNVVAPYRQGGWRKVSLYGNLGVGAGGYYYKHPDQEKLTWHGTALGMASLSLAFNVSKSWELFLEGQYRSYTKEDMGGGVDGGRKSTDAIVGFFGVRYKLNATKATNGHSRDLSAPEYEEVMRGDKSKFEDMADQINALRDKTDGVAKDVEDLKNNTPTKADVNDLSDRVKALENEVKRLKKGESATIAFDNVVFETGSAKLTPASTAILDNLINMLKMHSISSLEIAGHTDNVGKEAFNQKLSERRAEAVKAYIVNNSGFDSDAITTNGYGLKKPIADNNTPQGRQKNRRVEVTVTK
ncbi:MAG: OmpA family protein [Prevotellaceae bacterium]|jgi:outer membrane protein OmpA-like peptidoglycan-associated protein|nr:OmpA family protein [Prevotellaceae bacterium]